MTKTTIAATVLSAAIAQAGNFTAYDFGAFKMHVYNSGDVMGDASFIVEGKSELVVLEVPLFQENAKEFDAYVAKLQKPIVASITDYHEGAVKDSKLYVAEGMKSFLVGPIYGGRNLHRRKSLFNALGSGERASFGVTNFEHGCGRCRNCGGKIFACFGCRIICRQSRRLDDERNCHI